MSYTVSKHAQVRQQQRCIPDGILEWLLNFGDREHDGRDGIHIRFTKASIRRMARRYGQDIARALEGYFNVYVVVSTDDPTVITVGYIYGGKKSPIDRGIA